MARDTKARTVYRCTESFSPDGRTVWAEGDEVLDGEPILKTHRAFFEEAASRVMRSRHVEQATAAPGELRTVSTSPTPMTSTSTEGAHRGEEG